MHNIKRAIPTFLSPCTLLQKDDIVDMTEPPPPYSESADSAGQGYRADSLMQLRRYIIEIVAFNINADFDVLNVALGQSTTSTSTVKSILTENERADLLRLACIIKDFYGNRKNLQSLPASQDERSTSLHTTSSNLSARTPSTAATMPCVDIP